MTDWRNDLGRFFEQTEKTHQESKESEISRFLTGVAVPAFEEISEELKRYGRDVSIRNSATAATISVHHAGDEEMTYRIQGRTFPNGVLPYAEIRFRERKGLKLITVESMIRPGPPNYRLDEVTRAEVIRDFLSNYTSRVHQR